MERARVLSARTGPSHVIKSTITDRPTGSRSRLTSRSAFFAENVDGDGGGA
jgi:hypothetical protein